MKISLTVRTENISSDKPSFSVSFPGKDNAMEQEHSADSDMTFSYICREAVSHLSVKSGSQKCKVLWN
jgi:hypothetical protein